MMKQIIALLTISTVFFISNVIAGEWVAVDGGKKEVNLIKKEFENKMWNYLSTFPEYKFEPKEKYTYQYQVNIG